jgi:uncharacterized protein YcfL
MRKTLLKLLLLSLVLTGCVSNVVIYPITTQDIIILKKGQQISAPSDGYFLSEFYLKEVVDAKLKK